MIVTVLSMAMAQPTFYEAMQDYLACVEQRLPADMQSKDRPTRTRIYRAAAARCQAERKQAIAAAVRQRPQGQSEADAMARANGIIDDLDPGV